MNLAERDDFLYSLKTTMDFYGKTLDKGQLKVWYRALSEYPLSTVQQALEQYPQVGKYAPKPVDIIEIVGELRQRQAANDQPEKPPKSDCPPEIAQAWLWFIGQITQDSENFTGLFEGRPDIPAETKEKYLHIVNHEARRTNHPDAIPDEYKLPEVWG